MACIISRIYQANDRVPFPGRLFRLLVEHDGEFCFASIGGIVEGFAGTVTLRGMEVEAVFNPVRQPRDAGFAVDVGSDFEIQLVGIHESVGDVDSDFGVIDGDASGVCDGEISGAGAYASVDDGDGVRVDFGVGLGGQHGQGENHRGECGQDEENWGYGSWFSVHGHPYKGTLSGQVPAAVGFRGSGYQGSLPALGGG
jgi:hypothetical protein